MLVISRDGMELAFAFDIYEDHNILFANPLHAPRHCHCTTPSYHLNTETWVWVQTLAAGGDLISKTNNQYTR